MEAKHFAHFGITLWFSLSVNTYVKVEDCPAHGDHVGQVSFGQLIIPFLMETMRCLPVKNVHQRVFIEDNVFSITDFMSKVHWANIPLS